MLTFKIFLQTKVLNYSRYHVITLWNTYDISLINKINLVKIPLLQQKKKRLLCFFTKQKKEWPLVFFYHNLPKLEHKMTNFADSVQKRRLVFNQKTYTKTLVMKNCEWFYQTDKKTLNHRYIRNWRWNLMLYGTVNKNTLNGILLVNFPEKEKMFLVKTLAAENKIPLIIQSASLLFKDPWEWNNSSTVKDPIQVFFDKVKTTSPCICFFNDLDSIGEQRHTHINKSRRSLVIEHQDNDVFKDEIKPWWNWTYKGIVHRGNRGVFNEDPASKTKIKKMSSCLFSINYAQGIKFLSKPIKFNSAIENKISEKKKFIWNTSVEPRFVASALLKFLEILDGLCGLL